MALSDNLNGKTEQQLIDDGEFINALVGKLKVGAGDNGVYTKKGVDDELAKKADTSAIPAAPDLSHYLETSKLAEEVVKKPVVDALIPELAKDDGTTGIYTKKGVDDELAKKADTSAIPAAPDLSHYLETSKLAEEVVKKPVIEAIFDAKDNHKSILVEKLGGFLDAPETPYGARSNQAAKDFLADKGLKPTPTDVANELITNNIQALQTAVAANAGLQKALAANADLRTAVAADAGLKAILAKPADIAAITDLQEAVAKNPDLQKAVAADAGLQTAVAQNVDLHKAIILQPSFEALSWDW